MQGRGLSPPFLSSCPFSYAKRAGNKSIAKRVQSKQHGTTASTFRNSSFARPIPRGRERLVVAGAVAVPSCFPVCRRILRCRPLRGPRRHAVPDGRRADDAGRHALLPAKAPGAVSRRPPHPGTFLPRLSPHVCSLRGPSGHQHRSVSARPSAWDRRRLCAGPFFGRHDRRAPHHSRSAAPPACRGADALGSCSCPRPSRSSHRLITSWIQPATTGCPLLAPSPFYVLLRPFSTE